jgi:N-acetylmuramoyl-L-alanine amidase
MLPDLPPSLPMTVSPLPYELRLEERPRSQIDLVVIHCTELPDLADARKAGEQILYASGTGNSGHYYIDRDGSIHVYVRPERIAHHVRGNNPRAVGIELVNTGRYPDWLDSRNQKMEEPYTEAQIAAVIGLLQTLQKELPALKYIAGHEDLDTTLEPSSNDPGIKVHRKLDPGPLFPWKRVMEAVALERLKP